MSRTLRIGLVLLVVAYAASRAPFLRLGYGLDDDAWLMARAADTIASGAGYTASRLPGYPTAELGTAAVFAALGASFAVGNGTVAVVGLAGVLGLAAFLLGERLPHPLLGAAALAFHPAFWGVSTTTLDFAWNVTALILALVAVQRRHFVLAGVLIGLAAGARLTDAAACLPLAVLAWQRERRLAPVLTLAGAAGLATAAVYLPVLARYGTGFLTYDPALHRDYLIGAYKIYAELLGLPLVLIAGAAAYAAWRHRHDPAGGPDRSGLATVAALAIGALLLPFLLLPIDTNYLLGALPFAIVLISCLRQRRWSAALLVALVVPSFVSLALLDVEAWRTAGKLELVAAAPGAAVASYTERAQQLEHAQSAAAYPYPSPSTVVLGRPFCATQWAMGRPIRDLDYPRLKLPGEDVVLWRLLPRFALADARARGPVYFASGEQIPYLTRRIYGYSIGAAGGRELRLWGAGRADEPVGTGAAR